MGAGVGSGDDDSEIHRKPLRMVLVTVLVILGALGLFMLSTQQAMHLIDSKSVDGQRHVVANLLADPAIAAGVSTDALVRHVTALGRLRGARLTTNRSDELDYETDVPMPVEAGATPQFLVWSPYRAASETFTEVAPYRLIIVALLIPMITVLLWRFRAFALDLDRQRRAARRLAARDSLTDLANRLAFEQGLEAALVNGEKTGCAVALLLLDLNGFKQVNDRLGHVAGDAVLVGVAQRLQGTAGSRAIVARLGGDEFAIILPLPQGAGPLFELALDLHTVLAEPHTVDGTEVEAPASIGIALSPEHGRNLSELLSRADAALYAAKARPDRPFLMYEPRTERPTRAAA